MRRLLLAAVVAGLLFTAAGADAQTPAAPGCRTTGTLAGGQPIIACVDPTATVPPARPAPPTARVALTG